MTHAKLDRRISRIGVTLAIYRRQMERQAASGISLAGHWWRISSKVLSGQRGKVMKSWISDIRFCSKHSEEGIALAGELSCCEAFSNGNLG